MYYKYPRTYHLPFSLGKTNDDKTLKNTEYFIGKNVVVTEKMDGENTSLYSNGKTHARSIDSKNHESRNWIKNFGSERFFLLDKDLRVCGENLYAKHSIHYKNLKSYFYGFSVWNKDVCLSWRDTIQIFQTLKICPVPVLYEGKFEDLPEIIINDIEGYVIRNSESFNIKDFKKNIAKFVRENHVQTNQHWMNQKIIKNLLVKISIL